jgi:hypothetical protein
MVTHNTYAQQNPVRMGVLANPSKDSIMLRWAPGSTALWQQANVYGYMIKRYTVVRNGKVLPVPEERNLTSQPIKPLPLRQWEVVVKQQERWGSIAAQALYGEDFDLKATGIGGKDVMSMYNKSKAQDSRYSFTVFAADQSWIVAKAAGLAFVDMQTDAAEKYLYRIYIPGIKSDTGFVFTGAADQQPVPSPRDLRAEKTTKAALLSWDKVMFSHLYASFVLERSDDGGNTFVPVTGEPIVNAESSTKEQPQQRMFYIDTVPQPGQLKVYRVRALTPFGQLSPPSDTIHVTVMDVIKVHPSITGTAILNNGVLIKWMMPTAPVKGFDIERSTSAKKGYNKINKQLLSSRDTVFMDEAPLPSNYYRIRAYTTDGQSTYSFAEFVQLEDSIPPAAPDSLAGEISDSGQVLLHWKSNTEEDLYGYRVFRANETEAEFVQVTREPALKNAFRDTIEVKTLTKYVYYKIVALDKHYNPSEFSAVLQLKRPDVVPPVPPVFTDARADKNGIILEWQPSTSEDVVQHQVLRSIDTVWSVIHRFNTPDTTHTFTDSSATPGVKYRYCIAAIDDSQLKSVSKVLSMQRTDLGIIPGNYPLRAFIDKDNRCILLKWQTPVGITRIWLYRSSEGGPMRIFKTLPGDAHDFKDSDLLINTPYRYKLKMQRQTDGAALFTEEILVNY